MTITNPKLSYRIRPDVEAAPWVIAEIEKLEQQLEQAHADIAGLHDQLEEPQIVQEDYRLNKIELEESRQHVTLLREQVTLLREPLLYIDEVAKTSKTIISVAAAAMKMLKRIRAALAATEPKEYRGVHVAKEQ